jgi:hypothetical protein
MMGKKAYTKPRLLYDGLGYFVVLTGTFLSLLVTDLNQPLFVQP